MSRRYPSLAPLLRSFISRVVRLSFIWSLSLRSLRPQIPKGSQRTPTAQIDVTPGIPLTVVAEPTRIFNDTHIDWVTHGADARCVAWVLHSTTYHDVILSSVRFAADIVWHPAIAEVISPFALAELFFGCFVDKQLRPGSQTRQVPLRWPLPPFSAPSYAWTL